MAVFSSGIFANDSRGAGLTEVLLALAVVGIATPFVYNQVVETTRNAADIRTAGRIIDMRGPALNFVRMQGDRWPDVAQIRLTPEDLAQIADGATAGFIDKYAVSGASVTDIYLAFDLGVSRMRAASVARHIGIDAAVVDEDGIAYGQSWAVTAPDFLPGDLIYKISRGVVGEDTAKYLHRGTSGEDQLNVMQRDLNMGGHNVYDVGGVVGKSAKINGATAMFIETKNVAADAVYFSAGANIDGGTASLGALRVTGDITGFRNIVAASMNGSGYTTAGRVIADRATVTNSVNVARDLTLKSDVTRTISGFDGISASTVATPFISADEIIFYDNFGLTLSGELLMSTTAPLKIGSWTFPSNTPPKFSKLTLSRAEYPAAVRKTEFAPIMRRGWMDGLAENETTPNNF
ncbi:MAG: hypothetical protein K2I81_04360 [Alphaproteobacteria bacterium]|nr:hypothetical protein [Alphaproteobacteria bacterium]